jgi:CYTH domain-containing protein
MVCYDEFMGIELERTFLAAAMPNEIRGAKPLEVIDIYVPSTSEHPNLRIRKRGDIYEITKKAPSHNDASEQTEQTVPLTAEEFLALSRTSSKSLAKYRYKVKIEGHTAEVDVFKEKLTGLVLIDFEFNTDKDKASFVAPYCCLIDVTQETFIAGGMLAGKTYKDIEKDLKRLSYRKILD